MKKLAMSIAILLWSGFGMVVHGQADLSWIRYDLGDEMAFELGSGIALDANKNVIVVGSTNELDICDPEAFYNPFDEDDCDDFESPYGVFNQVYWKLSQNGSSPVPICGTPYILATCNEIDDMEPNAGTANDVVSTPNGATGMTGTCHTGEVVIGLGLPTNAYLRTFGLGCDDLGTEEIDGDPAPFYGHAAARFRNSFVVVTGTYTNTSGDTDLYVAKFVDGAAPVVKIVPNPADEDGNGIAVDIFGNIYVTGTTDGSFAPNFVCNLQSGKQSILLKFDSDLNEIWRRQFSAGCFSSEVACSVATSCNGKAVYVAGHQQAPTPGIGRRGLVRKFANSGNLAWVRFLGGPGTPVETLSAKQVHFYDVATDLSGGVYVTGATDGSISPQANGGDNETTAFVARYDDSSGNGLFQWAEQIDNDAYPFDESISYSITIDREMGPDYNADIYIGGQVVTGSIVGSGGCGFIDQISLTAVVGNFDILAARFNQTEALVIKGDVNGDGFVNGLDVFPFRDKLFSGTYCPSADVNCDGAVNLLDQAVFVDMLNNPCN